MKNIIYLRVSKEEEGLQDLDAQRKAIIEKFGIKDYEIYKERGSAYDLNKFHKRKEFIKILDLLFDSESITIKDLFLRNIEKKQSINLYIWDYARIIRNFEYNLFFGLLSDIFEVTIYSYKDGKMTKKIEETPTEKLGRFLLYSISAFGAEDYSYQTSQNIKKSVNKEKGITINKEGTKWGRHFKRTNGKRAKLSPTEIINLNKRISNLINIFEEKKEEGYYKRIIKIIAFEEKLKISKAYISKIKKKSQKNNLFSTIKPIKP